MALLKMKKIDQGDTVVWAIKWERKGDEPMWHTGWRPNNKYADDNWTRYWYRRELFPNKEIARSAENIWKSMHGDKYPYAVIKLVKITRGNTK
jgi:hypothetical protein